VHTWPVINYIVMHIFSDKTIRSTHCPLMQVRMRQT